MITSRSCAYCDAIGSLTREHVWPECFLELWGRTAAHFSVQAQRVHGADYVVADVCPDCNSKRLSLLDAYFCQFYEDVLSEVQDFDSEVDLAYDYDLLARTLLKIAFNSARGAGSDPGPFLPFREYILGRSQLENPLAIFAELVSPALRESKENPGEFIKIPPRMYRSVVTGLRTPNGHRLHTRIIAVNSFYFHIALPVGPLTLSEFRVAAAEIPQYVDGLVEVERGATQIRLRTSPRDGLSSIEHMVRHHLDQYREFFDRKTRRDD